MAKIREYQQQTSAQVGIPGRRAQASTFGGRGIRDIGIAITKVAEKLEDRQAELEVTDAHTQLTKAQADWTVNLRDRGQQADPSDGTFSEVFNEDLKKYLDDLRPRFQTFRGQQTFDRGAAVLSANFVAQSGAFQAQLAGTKAAEDFAATVDSLQIVVNNDPSQFEEVRIQLDAIIDDPDSTYARIPAKDKERIKRSATSQIAASTMEGIIRSAPKFGMQLLENPSSNASQYLTGEQLSSLKSEAATGIKGELVEEARVRTAVIAARKEVERLAKEEIVESLSRNELTVPMIMGSKISAPDKEHYLGVLKANIKEQSLPVREEPSVFLSAIQDIRSGDITNETQIEDIYASSVESGRGITWTQTEKLRKELRELRTPEGATLVSKKNTFMKGVLPLIDKSNPLLGKIDASGKRQSMEFEFFIEQKVEQYKADPKKDPYDLFDKSKPDYLGKDEVLVDFQKTIQESIRDFSRQIRRDSPDIISPDKHRKDKETIDEYLNRTEGK